MVFNGMTVIRNLIKICRAVLVLRYEDRQMAVSVSIMGSLLSREQEDCLNSAQFG